MLPTHEENFLLLHISRIRGKSCIIMSRYLGRQALNVDTDKCLSFWLF